MTELESKRNHVIQLFISAFCFCIYVLLNLDLDLSCWCCIYLIALETTMIWKTSHFFKKCSNPSRSLFYLSLHVIYTRVNFCVTFVWVHVGMALWIDKELEFTLFFTLCLKKLVLMNKYKNDLLKRYFSAHVYMPNWIYGYLYVNITFKLQQSLLTYIRNL